MYAEFYVRQMQSLMALLQVQMQYVQQVLDAMHVLANAAVEAATATATLPTMATTAMRTEAAAAPTMATTITMSPWTPPWPTPTLAAAAPTEVDDGDDAGHDDHDAGHDDGEGDGDDAGHDDGDAWLGILIDGDDAGITFGSPSTPPGALASAAPWIPPEALAAATPTMSSLTQDSLPDSEHPAANEAEPASKRLRWSPQTPIDDDVDDDIDDGDDAGHIAR